MNDIKDFTYQISREMFSKMSKGQLIELKQLLENDREVDIGGAKIADEDMLADLNRYFKENKIK